MLARLALAAIVWFVAFAAQAADCIQTQAIYTEKNNGYVLSFRKPDPWEGAANMMAVLDLAFPDGETHLWGTIWIPNGTSHDRIRLLDGCSLPTFDPATDIEPSSGSDEDELEACTVWKGIVLALAGNDVEGLLWHDGASAAETILLPDLGPAIRYSGLVASPGDEPHEVFALSGCAV